MNRFKLLFTVALLVVASGSPNSVLANAAGGLKPVIERVTALEARSAALEEDLARARSDLGSLEGLSGRGSRSN